jgi:hypothetical protein
MWLQSQTEAFQLRVYLSFYVFYAWRLAVPLSRAERGKRAPRFFLGRLPVEQHRLAGQLLERGK